MPVKIRLSRIGKKHVPFYRVVAVDSRKKRDGAFLDDLGTYDATNSKLVRLEPARIAEWVSKGAVPTDSVKKLLKKYKKEQAAPKVAPKKAAPKKAAAPKKTTKPAEKAPVVKSAPSEAKEA